jgi:tetratricopeptide (TPR) repeat protein
VEQVPDRATAKNDDRSGGPWRASALAGTAIACVALAALVTRVWPSVNLNRALLTCVRPGEPATQCEAALDLDNPRALYYAGFAAWHSGNPARAATLLRGATAQYPNNPAAALVLGQAISATGDAAGAAAIWRQAGAFPYFLHRARSRTSLEDAKIAVALDPANASAHEVMGRILESQGRLADAAEAYRHATDAVRPDDAALAWLLKGHERRLLGDDAGAVDAYQRAADAAPSAISPLFLLAEAAARQRDFQRAEAVYQRLLQLSPADLYARLALAEVWLNAGDTRRAGELFELIAAQVPDSGRASAYLGHMALQRGDPREASRRLEEAVAREPELGWAHTELGNARRAQGDTAGALQAYREAVRLDPNQTHAAEQLRILNLPGRSPQ